MPRFLHTADLHINALRKFDGYLARHRQTLLHISKIALEENVDFIIVADDIYDRRDISHAERQLLSEWLSVTTVPIVAISGNHDKRSDEVGDTCISYLSSLSDQFSRHILYDGPPSNIDILGCRLILLPYQGWMDQEFYLILQSKLLEDNPERLPIIVVLHEAVYGCKTDTGFSVTKSNQIKLDSSFPEVTYWALGDIHAHQEVLENAWYPGSPHQTRFDESTEKGVLIVDTDYPTSPKFIRVDTLPLLTFTTQPLEGWPSPTEAFVQYKPEVGTDLTGYLPDNVDYHPATIVPARVVRKGSPITGILDGLDLALSRSALPLDLYPLAWRLAVTMAESLGESVELPDKYQIQSEDQ